MSDEWGDDAGAADWGGEDEKLPDAAPLTRQVSDASQGWDGGDDVPEDFGDDADGWGDDAGGDGDGAGDDAWGEMTAADDAAALVDQIPHAIQRRVVEDVKEVRAVQHYVAADADFGGGTRIILRIGFPASSLGLEIEQARAWTLDLSKLIMVELSMPPHYWNVTNHSEIKVKVFQATHASSDDMAGFGLSWTIENRIKTKFFSTLPNTLEDRPYALSDVEEIMDMTGCDFQLAVAALGDCKGKVDQAAVQLLSGTNKTKLVRQISVRAEEEQKQNSIEQASPEVKNLMQINGVSADVAKLALSLEASADAAALLLTDSAAVERLQGIVDEQQRKQEAEAAAQASDGSWWKDVTGLGKKKKGKQRKKGSDESKVPGPPQLRRATSDPAEHSLVMFLSKHNYLVRVVTFAKEALKNCHQFCVICGRQLAYVGLKPSICDSALCKVGFEQLGLGFDLSGIIMEQPDVLDMLISTCYAAAQMRRLHFVTPITVVSPPDSSGKEHSFVLAGKEEKFIDALRNNPDMEQKAKEELFHECLDCAKVKEVLDRCPSVRDMQNMIRQGTLESDLRECHILLLPLLRWIMTSNRAHLRQMEEHEKVKEFNTPFQFVLLSNPPEKEVQFKQLKAAAALEKSKGSIYAWHGSSIANWHSILRTGLKNMSNTKYMTAGAAYGAGIYMSPNSGTSMSYSNQQGGWANSRFGTNIRILAVCEVVNHRDLKPPNPHYVVPQELWVTTRFVLVLPSSTSLNLKIEDVENKLPRLG